MKHIEEMKERHSRREIIIQSVCACEPVEQHTHTHTHTTRQTSRQTDKQTNRETDEMNGRVKTLIDRETE